jgi:superfamily II DNA/RNA helicase
MEQEDRERVLIQFRNGSIKYLVATDLAARGLDIEAMKHVIHYQLPQKEEEFLHRNGRTARMYETGTAYLLLNQEEKQPAYLEKITCEAHTLQPPFELPTPADFLTVYVSGGRKNKINKVDIVGFFLQKGGLEKQDVGLIEVKDFSSFVAVRENKVFPFLKTIRHEKMKGKKYKIELAR